jgi:hypothetical protein
MTAAEREKLVQMRGLNAFLAQISALDDVTKRFNRYVQAFFKLRQQQRAEPKKWSSVECKRGDLGELVQKIASLRIPPPALTHLAPSRPISMGQSDFFRAFGVFLEKDLREVAVNRSWRRNCPPDSRSYNTLLVARIDTYLSRLDHMLLLQAHADEAHARTQVRRHAETGRDSDASDGSDGSETAYGSDAEYEEKGIRKQMIDVELKMNNDFLQVILFLFAVPQEVPLRARERRWAPTRLEAPLEPAAVNMNVAWMMDDCRWYQQNAKFMELLADCAVIALMRENYEFSPAFTEICQSYIDLVADYEKTDAFAEVVGQQERIDDDSVDNINTRVRSAAHARRPGRHAADPGVDVAATPARASAAGSTGAALAALRSIYHAEV